MADIEGLASGKRTAGTPGADVTHVGSGSAARGRTDRTGPGRGLESQHFLKAVVGALGSVHLIHPDGHHLGRPYVTSYQIAVKVDHTHPTIRGGTRVDVRDRLAIPNPFVSQGVVAHAELVLGRADEVSFTEALR